MGIKERVKSGKISARDGLNEVVETAIRNDGSPNRFAETKTYRWLRRRVLRNSK